MSQTENKETSSFVRVLITIFCLLLAVMVLFNYLWVDPKGEINNGILALLFFLLVLVLAESFDNFSFGKLISISREAKKKDIEVKVLEKKNSDLLTQLISVTNTNTQNQNHTNVYGDYHAPSTVTKASDEEVEESKNTEQTSPDPAPETATPVRTSYNWREAERIALTKHLNNKNVHKSNVITEAKLTTQFHGVDPVSNIQPIYDAYYRDGESEVFVEFRPNRGPAFMFRDRLYVMLSKISHYKATKNVGAHLELVLMNIPEEDSPRNGGFNRILEQFEPAIASGLLRVSEIEFNEQELSEIRE